ncbi:hypothetical protein BS17DRAFT_775171 [Gyrodon lividus]|nr:hypothetical protein BS17DRAFT_775171 [Gyrodon lividus]
MQKSGTGNMGFRISNEGEIFQGREVRGSECPMKENLSKVKSEGQDSGFDHRGSELGWMG